MSIREVFTVKEVAEYLSVSESAIRKLVTEKGIPHFRILRKIMFSKESIDTWIRNQEESNQRVKVSEGYKGLKVAK